MAKYSKILINVPDLNRAYIQGTYKYSSPSVILDNGKVISSIKANLTPIISTWGKEFEIDNEILIGFIATESGGKNAPKNQFNAIGYMQATPITVFEVITKWNDKVSVPLSAQTKALLAKNVPNYTKWKRDEYSVGDANHNAILKALANPEFNIAMGAATIRWMLEAFNNDGGSPLNKVMVAYNRGYSSTKNLVKGDITSEKMMKLSLGKEAKAYILKMLGRYGFLDLMFNK
jgi:soluble lytic murein transglycosylase-like protein